MSLIISSIPVRRNVGLIRLVADLSLIDVNVLNALKLLPITLGSLLFLYNVNIPGLVSAQLLIITPECSAADNHPSSTLVHPIPLRCIVPTCV